MSGGAQKMQVEILIIPRGPWHVGSGLGSLHAGRLVRVRNISGNRVPFIPGSHLKGVIRNRCEQLVAALGGDVLSPHIAPENVDQATLAGFCPLRQSQFVVDRLFGNRYQGECLFVEDAVPLSDTVQAKLATVTRTSISRLTGTVRHRTLFTTQYVCPPFGHASARGRERRIAPSDGELANGALRAVVHARHAKGVLTPWEEFPMEYALLLAAITTVDRFGGDKSMGFGTCEIVVPAHGLRWNGQQIPLERALRSFAECGNEPTAWIDWLNVIRSEEAAS